MEQRVTVHDSGIDLQPDHSRVVTQFFVPGREVVGPGDSRAGPVIDRILQLDEAAVTQAVDELTTRFAERHRDLHHMFLEHADIVTPRVDTSAPLSNARRLLIGAMFTHEYSIEGASICNPSAVMASTQGSDGGVNFVLSVRGIGEGHRSTIGFRTGHLDNDGRLTVDAPGPFPVLPSLTTARHHLEAFRGRLTELGDNPDNSTFILDALPSHFDDTQLSARIHQLVNDPTRANVDATAANLRLIADCSYRVTFPVGSELSERVLWPRSSVERVGMEDARFVRFVDERGDITYYATYTAFDGAHVRQQLIETSDFITFSMSPLTGAAASNKGMALFPRLINGRYAALSRADRESNWISFSDDVHCWQDPVKIQAPQSSWEIVQIGNCGSPIETDQGWLVVTHGAGAMRTYSIGFILLDLNKPERLIAHGESPVITSWPNHTAGYVPNVVYSCGGFAHGDTLVLPYAFGDQCVTIATMSITEVLASLRRV